MLTWANDQDWIEGYSGQSAQTLRRLEDEVFDALAKGAIYELEPPTDEDAHHEYGWTLGINGYHEFVVIDRATPLPT